MRILFLDDMQTRHNTFRDLVEDQRDLDLLIAYNASQAISYLGTDGCDIDQAFLDHDLSEEDIMCEVGGASRVPTGMTVVDHIVTMKAPPRQVIVHTCNGPAGDEMERRLKDAGIQVIRLPFPHLVHALRQSKSNGS